MSDTYQLKITYTHGHELAKWDFDNKGPEKCCTVKEGDQIQVTFDGSGKLEERVLLCGQMKTGELVSPFTEASPIDLKANPTLTVGKHTGTWAFSIAFTARNADSTSSFYYVPDPEIIVDPNPGSCD